MNAELKPIIEGLSPSTQTAYTNSYKKLRDVLGMKDNRKLVKKNKLQDVLTKLELIQNPNTRYAVLVVVMKLYNEPKYNDTVVAYREKLKKLTRKHKACDNKKLQTDIPTFDEINKAVKKETDPVKYITSFIILKINTRNQDVAFTDIHKSVEDETQLDQNRNHIYIKGAKAIYIRNIYKTASTYGQKRNIILVKKFINMVQNLLGDKDKVSLFSKKDGSPISKGAVGSYLKKFIVLGLNEGQIVKSVIRHIEKNGDNEMLRRVAENRGSSVGMLMNEYDVNNMNKPKNIICANQEVKKDDE